MTGGSDFTEHGDDETDVDVSRVLQDRARALAVPRDLSGERDEELHLVASVGRHVVAIPAARSRHVVTPKPLARLVDCGPAIVGLAVVHGDLVPVADLALLLELDGRRGQAGPGRLVIIDDGESLLGLLVDDVDELLSFSPGDVRSDRSPTASTERLVTGVAHDGTFVLDLDAVLADERLWPAGAAPDTDDMALPR